MLGQPERDDVRDRLRIELRDYLIRYAHERWMWTLMRACGELDASDIEVLQENFVPLDALDTPTDSLDGCGPLLSIATSETAVPPPTSTSELSCPP